LAVAISVSLDRPADSRQAACHMVSRTASTSM
jgi:hypothetical protein